MIYGELCEVYKRVGDVGFNWVVHVEICVFLYLQKRKICFDECACVMFRNSFINAKSRHLVYASWHLCEVWVSRSNCIVCRQCQRKTCFQQDFDYVFLWDTFSGRHYMYKDLKIAFISSYIKLCVKACTQNKIEEKKCFRI